jgi:hypothetical protein
MTSATKPPSNAQARWTTHVPPYSRLIRNKHNKAFFVARLLKAMNA